MARKIKQQSKESINPQTGKVLMAWLGLEYEYHEKGTDWYWWVGLLAIIFFGIAVWQHSFLFAFLVLLGWFTVVLYAIRPPQAVSFAITERGIMIGNKLYFWHDLKSFWIFYDPPLRKELSVISKKTFVPPLRIPLDEEDPVEIRAIIRKFIPEIEEEESLIDNLARLAKF